MTERLEKSFLLGLYLFLRQLQLSIDRSFSDDWKSFVDYLSSKTSVQAVLDKLQSISTIDLAKRAIKGLERPALSRGLLSSVVGRKNSLSDDELTYIYAILKILALCLLKEDSPSRELLIRLRMDLQYSEELVASRISKSTLAGKEFVEHYNQSEFIECKAIDELVGCCWL